MAIKINSKVTSQKLVAPITRLFEVSAAKIRSLDRDWRPEKGTPVFTVKGKYTSRGWTEWTQGFQFGSTLLQFDATGDRSFLEKGRAQTRQFMASHVSHVGVHDHGFNNVSTYGNLWRLMREGKVPANDREREFYELALKISGAVQAARWTPIAGGGGFIHSFNGPHSLFIDTIRSLRSLAIAHQLGHVLMSEGDKPVSLLDRLLSHAATTARFSIYYGKGRDLYDVRGRTAHESIFNVTDGAYRCPNSQQGYSPFSTWTRGLAWAVCGFAEQLEFLKTEMASLSSGARSSGSRANSPESLSKCRQTAQSLLEAALATADFYLENCCSDGIPVWDTGAPNLFRLKNYRDKPADPFNRWEPVDSSAAAIAAQGLIRLGNYLHSSQRPGAARYRQAGLTIAAVLFDSPYLSLKSNHQGLLLHSVYHRPNGWDYVPPGRRVPQGESSLWGDYHLRELAVLILRQAQNEKYPTFFNSDRWG